MVREKMSRPNWSVPNHQRSDGGRIRLIGACRNGSPAMSGASTASATSASSIAAPMAIVGLRRMASPARAESDRCGGASSRAMAALTRSVPDARIEGGVGKVDQEIHRNLGAGEDEDE